MVTQEALGLAALSLGNELAEEAVSGATWTPVWKGVEGMSHQEEASNQTQDILEGLRT